MKGYEAATQTAILHLLSLLRIPAWRINTMGVPKIAGGKFQGFRPSPHKGIADILAVIPPSGRFLAIEVKGPSGVTSPEQEEFLAAIASSGGISMVARSVAEVQDALKIHGITK